MRCRRDIRWLLPITIQAGAAFTIPLFFLFRNTCAVAVGPGSAHARRAVDSDLVPPKEGEEVTGGVEARIIL